MRQPLVVLGLGGVASALLYLSFGAGGGLPLFAYFVQLPLTFTGLALGVAPAGLAALLALTLVAVFGGWLAGLLFLVVQALPSLLVVRLALLWREDGSGAREWYPPGPLVGHVALYVFVASAAGLLFAHWYTGDLEALLARSLFASLSIFGGVPATAGEPPVPDWLFILPGLVAASWILMCCVDALLAQLLAARSGMALRPTPRLSGFVVPSWASWALAAASLGVLLLAGPGLYLAATALFCAAMLYLFQGLGVVHALLSARLPGRLPLAVFYLVLLVFSWPLVLVVVMLGLVEDWARFRERLT